MTCLEIPTRTAGENFFVLSGACSSSGSCTQSPNYPMEYGASEYCEILAPERPLYFVHFVTALSDPLTIDGQAYSGGSRPVQGTITSEIIRWTSDLSGSGSGWQICVASLVNLGKHDKHPHKHAAYAPLDVLALTCSFRGGAVGSRELVE